MTVNNGGGDDAAADNGGAADDDNKGDARPQAMDLDSVHARVMAEKGEEFSRPEGEAAEEEDDAAADEGAADAAADADNQDDAAAAAAAEEDAEEEDDAAAAAEEPVVPTAPEAPEQDDDITKPGKYKAEFIDEDGKKYYVSDVTQLPDDFEPQSNRHYGIALQQLGDKRSDYRADMAKYETDKATSDKGAAAAALRTSWNKDIDTLAKDGIALDDGRKLSLPSDPKERDKAIVGTYKLMDAEMKKGNTIEKFSTAYELYDARQTIKAAAAAEAKAKQEADEAKKQKGGKVMGGGAAPVNGGNNPLIRKGVPQGIGLDAVHQRALRKIQ